MAFPGDYRQPQTPSTTAVESLLSPRSVSYCCGSCGYALNLSSSDRNTSNFVSKYRKSIKKGVVSFVSVDESRFSQVQELRCRPYFESKRSWGLLRKRTKLFCRNCRNFVGVGYEDSASSPVSDSGSANGEAASKKYYINIRALQPSSSDESGAGAAVGTVNSIISRGRSTLSTAYRASSSPKYMTLVCLWFGTEGTRVNKGVHEIGSVQPSAGL